jgi:hypothetical protein
MGKYFGSDDRADELFTGARTFTNYMRTKYRAEQPGLSHVNIATNHGYVVVCLRDEAPCMECLVQSSAEDAYAYDVAKSGRA